MVQINTVNGEFNITESLLEAIKINNPEILVEKSSMEYQTLMNQARKYGMEGLPQDIEQQISKLSKDEQKNIRTFIKNQKKQIKNADNKLGQNDKESSQLEKQPNVNKLGVEDASQWTLKQFVESEDLHQQIQDAEKMATGIIKRAKRVIHTAVGIVGSHTSATPSKFKTPKTQTQQPTNGAQNTDANQNVQANDVNKNTQDSIKNYYDTNSDWRRKTGSEIKLAIGGFKFSPLFGKAESSTSGKALKYYKASQRPTPYSYIDEMVNKFILIKSNPDKFEDNAKEDKKYLTDFTDMAYSYLHNVVYRLEINNDSRFSSIINALRLDPVLNDLFDVTNVNTVQLLDTKEQVIAFKDKKSGIISMIIVATPMFAVGKEIWNNLKPIHGYLQNLKG